MIAYAIFAAFVLFVALPVLFHFEKKADKKYYEFHEHVSDAIRITSSST